VPAVEARNRVVHQPRARVARRPQAFRTD